jgi:hypothetical protein
MIHSSNRMGLMLSRAQQLILLISGEFRRIGWRYPQLIAEAEDSVQDVA